MNKVVFFDLDGTLVNSIGGIAASVNRTLADYGFPALDEKLILTYIGNGARKLIERASAGLPLPVSIDEAKQTMVNYYNAYPLEKTSLYPGVAEGLQKLSANGFYLVVVSNKPQTVADKILTGLNVRDLFTENIGDGSGFPLKPAPDAFQYFLGKHGINTSDAFMVGDNYTDIEAAANAGIRSVFCTYGYGKKRELPAFYDAADFSLVTDFILKKHDFSGISVKLI